MNYQGLVTRLEEIIQMSSEPEEFQGLRAYLERCFSSDIPSHKRRITDLSLEFAHRHRFVRPEDAAAYDSLRKQGIKLLENMGYRSNIWTSQEHALGGSSGQVPTDPYKPLGLLDGTLTLEETRRSRELSRIAGASITFFEFPDTTFPKDVLSITVTLEPLDDEGNTIRDPQPLNRNLQPITNYRKTGEFPYRRD